MAGAGNPTAGSGLVVSRPGSLAEVDGQCAAVEAAADASESVPQIKDWSNRLAAIDEYLARTSTEGRARVAAAQRRLEVRIGVLLGPAPSPQESGARKGSIATEPSDGLSKDERHQFRTLASNPDAVEAVIADSDDGHPASRRQAVAAAKKKDSDVPTRQWIPAAERSEQIRTLSEKGNTAAQIADHLGIGVQRVRDVAKEFDIALPDKAIGKTRRVDHDRIVNETVTTIDGLAVGVGLVDTAELDPNQVAAWVKSLDHSLRILNRLHKQMKDITS